jgi:OOP family OmpA-OmpF porin
MAQKNKNNKILITTGVLLALGLAFVIYRRMTKDKRECSAKGGTWDDKTKTCVLPKQEDPDVVKDAYENLQFEIGKAIIKPQSFPSLDELAKVFVEQPTWKLNISGHTDNTGSAEFNNKLSMDRAVAVKKYLGFKGVDANRINAIGFGATQPIADNTTPEGRELNRRVEFTIIK